MLEAFLIFAVVAGVMLFQTRGLPEGAAPPLAGQRNDGSAADLATLGRVGGGGTARPVLVAFWAEWCPVCKLEENNVEAVARDWPVLSVAMQSGDAAAVSRHLAARGLKTPAVVDPEGRHAANWRVRGVPTHYVVDGEGKVRFRVVGYATEWGLRARLWWAERFPA